MSKKYRHWKSFHWQDLIKEKKYNGIRYAFQKMNKNYLLKNRCYFVKKLYKSKVLNDIKEETSQMSINREQTKFSGIVIKQ